VTAHLAVEAVVSRLPAGWDIAPVRRLAAERGTRNPQLIEQPLSLSSTGVLYDRTDETDRQFASEQSARNAWVVLPGDLVVNPMWLNGGAIGVSDRRGAVSPDYRVYSLSSRLEPRYVHHLLRSSPYRDQYRLYMRAETTFDRRVTKDDFNEMPILVPPRRTQRAIADYLDAETARVDALTVAKRRSVELLRERRAAAVGMAVLAGTGRDDGRLGGSPAYWRRMPLKRIATLRAGEAITSEAITEVGDFPVFGGNGVRGFTTGFTHDGDFIVIGRQGALCGNINYASGRFWASEHAVVVTPKPGADVRWLGELLRTLNLNRLSQSAAQPGLSVEVLERVEVAIPPADEQQAIGDYLDTVTSRTESIVARTIAQITLILERRQAFITAAVTGQLKIPGVAA
jgi:type I restriction enzyme S subunit